MKKYRPYRSLERARIGSAAAGYFIILFYSVIVFLMSFINSPKREYMSVYVMKLNSLLVSNS
jgi:hypothetical protein